MMGSGDSVRHARAATSRPPSRSGQVLRRCACGNGGLRRGFLTHLEGVLAVRRLVLGAVLGSLAGSAAMAATSHPMVERFQADCLPMVEAEAAMPEGDHLVSETHMLRWKTMKSGHASCILSFRDDFVLPDDQRAEEQANRRAVAEEMRVAAPTLVAAMVEQGFIVCADTSTEKEHNTLLVKPLAGGRAISSLIWVLPEFPIAVMNVGVLTREETEEKPCEMELS